MVFSSMLFLWIFLPLVLAAYYISPGKIRNGILVFFSLLFYAWGEPLYVFLMLFSVAVNFTGGILIEKYQTRKKKILVATLIINLGLLGYFKYFGTLTEAITGLFSADGTGTTLFQVALPIGISFYTFQALSYVIDVYRGEVPAQHNFWHMLLYISFFPQLIAGPIVKYHDVEQEIEHRTQSADGVARGIRRFIAGLSKKVLISNVMGMTADALFGAAAGTLGAATAWVGALSYLFQIYFDFSGYSDMAIGLGWMFGFHFKENFNYPYSSTSIREFWRRWHISLSSWFLEYLYIPLGGNRKGKVRTCINKFIVFLCTGIWHGANVTFLFWGIYHGCFLMLEEFVPFFRKEGGKIKTAVMRIYTLLVVCIGFVFFRADTMTQGVQWVKAMFTGFSTGAASTSLALQQLTPLYLVTFTVACIASFPVFEKWKSNGRYQAFYNNMAFVCSIVGLVLCMLSLAGGTYNPFIYFRF